MSGPLTDDELDGIGRRAEVDRGLLYHEVVRLRASRDNLLRQQAALQQQVDELRVQVAGHGERIARQSELLARRAESGWRPIAEAPRDGTGFLGFDADYGRYLCSWFPDRWITNAAGMDVTVHPTHFQPLPQPPRLGDGGGGTE